jgi:hypothetical protein
MYIIYLLVALSDLYTYEAKSNMINFIVKIEF